MKIAYASTFDSREVQHWSGTPYYMSHAFIANNCDVEYIGNLKRKVAPFFKLKQFLKQNICGQRESPRHNIIAANYYSQQAAKLLKHSNADVVIAPQLNPIAYLECKQPIVLWTDALYASLIGFNSAFMNHSTHSIKNGNAMTAECLRRVKLAIFSSEWAARTAIEIYGAEKEKIKVVPFGANLTTSPTLDDVKKFLLSRSQQTVKLLFLTKRWELKNGKLVVEVAKKLHESGQAVELHLVGCHPPKDEIIPSYIHCHGFISKKTAAGIEKITHLLRESHFLIVPSKSEAFGIVFCEASAYGLPSLTTYVGGISSAVKDNINGMTFSLNASAEIYCDYILNLMNDYKRYDELALSSFNEFETRLNWRVATDTVKKLIQSF